MQTMLASPSVEKIAEPPSAAAIGARSEPMVWSPQASAHSGFGIYDDLDSPSLPNTAHVPSNSSQQSIPPYIHPTADAHWESTTPPSTIPLSIPADADANAEANDTSPYASPYHHLLCLHENLRDEVSRITTSLHELDGRHSICLLYTSPSPRDRTRSRMPSSA